MNELEFKKLWQETNDKMESSFFINNINSGEIARLKVYNFLSSMKSIKLFTLIVGFIWVSLGIMVLWTVFTSSVSELPIFFLTSATFQVVLTAIALVVYLYQLITLYNLDLTEPILTTQSKIAHLKASTIWVTKILFLQLPAWTTFWWNDGMFKDWNGFQLVFTLSITLIFTCIAIWLFINIKYENRNKKWFRIIFSGKEWDPLMRSHELLKVIEDYKDDDPQLNR